MRSSGCDLAFLSFAQQILIPTWDVPETPSGQAGSCAGSRPAVELRPAPHPAAFPSPVPVTGPSVLLPHPRSVLLGAANTVETRQDKASPAGPSVLVGRADGQMAGGRRA